MQRAVVCQEVAKARAQKKTSKSSHLCCFRWCQKRSPPMPPTRIVTNSQPPTDPTTIPAIWPLLKWLAGVAGGGGGGAKAPAVRTTPSSTTVTPILPKALPKMTAGSCTWHGINLSDRRTASVMPLCSCDPAGARPLRLSSRLLCYVIVAFKLEIHDAHIHAVMGLLIGDEPPQPSGVCIMGAHVLGG